MNLLFVFQRLLQVQAPTSLDSAIYQMPEQQEEVLRLSFFELFNKGGVIMYILLALSLIAIYIFVERMIIIRKAAKDDKVFMNKIADYMRQGSVKDAKVLCELTNTPLSHMIGKGINNLGKTRAEIDSIIENAGKIEVSSLEKNLPLLATIASVSPMIGFLGTVVGMVKAFYNMSIGGNNLDISLLSTGIYQAMVTTVGGLIVGIIAYILYNILVTRIEKVVFILETKSTEFMDVLDEPVK